MSKKNRINTGIVYSTNPEVKIIDDASEEVETLNPNQQSLKVKTDTKHRAGKMVTLVEGFIGKQYDLETLGKLLKTKCGCGGSVKDGIIVIQGDVKQKIIPILQAMYFKVK
jgi:translation initiation factor 1